MDDFDNFEFIDYTTSGPWERFITQIEDSLRSWGLVNGKLGVFDPAVFAVTEASDATVGAEPVKKQPAMTMAATSNIDKSDDEYSDNDTGEAGNNRGSSDSTNNNNNNNRSYQVREMLSLDDATYALSYHYHPAKARVAAGVERIDLEFLPISLEGVQHHSLHRWTSLTHILIISPVTISDIFASTMSSSSSTSMVIDLSSAKLLLSSFAIAFQNTGCSVPVFVPTGQPWNLTFTGLMIQPLIQPSAPDPSPDLSSSIAENEGTEWDEGCFEDDNYEQGVEVRFNTILVPYPPVQYTHLSGILDFFMERMGIEDCNPAASFTSGKYSRSLKEQIHTSALFCYDLVNWHDEDWRRWREGTGDKNVTKSTSNPNHETVFSSDNDEPILEAPDAAMNMDEIKTEDRNLSTLPIPVIPFGPIQDPLRSMRLFARFASMPCSVYLDNSNMADMDAGHANIWILQATFKEDSYGILSGILEDVISSWSSEAVGGERSEHKAGDGRAYGALLHKGARLIQGAISMVDAVEVENIVDTLFEGPPSPTPAATVQRPSSHPEIGANNHNIRLIPASELGLQFRHATTVPYNSFLWRMIQYLLDVVSPSSEVPYTTSAMGFIKVLWSELLKQFYSRWENSQLIPMVDIFGDGYTDDDKSSHKYNANQERKPVAIDLRYNLLHQKLSMLNCCIARQITCEKEAPRHIHPVLKRRKKKSKEQMVEDVELSQDNSHRHAVPGAQPIQNRTAQIQGLLHGLSNISRPRSADMVPTAKRLLESVKNRGAATFPQQQQQQCDQQDGAISPSSSATSSPTRPSTSQFTSKTEPSSPTAAVPIPKLETLGRRQSSSRQQSSDNDDDDEDVFYDPIVEDTTESLLDPYESQMQRRTLPMTESYVALKYSSSADSQSGVLVNDLDQSSVDVGGPDPREVADESKSEGGLMPLKDLKLLQTGAPLLIPKL
ncbi:Rab3 GTPase-activating protein catalytic subunit [Lobosporangium transversale]|nr:Rab3 GTPase-activating protein catalytic subunit [Lobosporangium transversale]